jgi:hypothetical protein
MPLWRYSGNRFLTFVENILVGKKLSEWHSGFRAYNLDIMKLLPYEKCVNGYEWTTDILLLYHTNGYPISEIVIPTHYGEDSTSPSKMRTLKYFITSFNLAMRFFLHRTKLFRKEKYKKIKT